jgi:hypothetical protein
MKHLLSILAVVLLTGAIAPPSLQAKDKNPMGPATVDADYRHATEESVERWRDLKFGMRIHWGLSSTLGMELSWPIAEAAPEL